MKSFLFTFSWALVLPLLAACGEVSDDDDGSGGKSTGASTSASGGPVCEGATCAVNEVCARPVGTCSGPLSCQPATSSLDEKVVCGCDGMNYKNAAEANGHGGAAKAGACDPPAGKFTCIYEYQVPIYCDLGTSYCKLTMTGDIYGLECADIPNGCTPAMGDCDCLNDPCSQSYCAVNAMNGGTTVLCMN